MCYICNTPIIMLIKKAAQHESRNFTTLFCNTMALHWFMIRIKLGMRHFQLHWESTVKIHEANEFFFNLVVVLK